MANAVFNVLLGLFSGAGLTILADAFIRPWYRKRLIARTLTGELFLHVQKLVHMRIERAHSPFEVDSTFFLDTPVIDAVTESLGIFPPALFADLMVFHGNLRLINRLHSQIFSEIEAYKRTVDGSRRQSKTLCATARSAFVI